MRMSLRPPRLPKSKLWRVLLALAALAILGVVIWIHPPNLGVIASAFRKVEWQWVAVAIALNLASVVVRALAWTTVIHQAMPPPHPKVMLVFSAFSVGLFANAVLPGRIGELARVAVLTRKMPERKGAWATLVGTVFAHRVFDIVPVVLLVLYVVLTADIPSSARATLLFVIGIGVGLFAFAFFSARRHHHEMTIDGLGPVRRLLTMGRHGVVLLLMNVVTIVPFWPGNVGLVQVAIASALVGYGVAYGVGVAYGFGLQAIEASVGIGVGLLFLAREGLSMAMLRVMPTASQAEMPVEVMAADAPDAGRERAGVS